MGLDLGFLEILVILVVALLVVGPEKLPEYARKLGKMVRDLRKMTQNFTGEVTKSLDMDGDFDDLKNTAQELKGSLDEESLKIKNALDVEAEEIAKTIDNEVSGAKKSIDDGTADLSAMLEKEAKEFDTNAREIKDPLAKEAQEMSETLNEGVDKLNNSLNADNAASAKKGRNTSSQKPEGKKVFDVPENNFNPFDGKPINPVKNNSSPKPIVKKNDSDKTTGIEETGQ
jgi:sec-independent protein translocase protein TatB